MPTPSRLLSPLQVTRMRMKACGVLPVIHTKILGKGAFLGLCGSVLARKALKSTFPSPEPVQRSSLPHGCHLLKRPRSRSSRRTALERPLPFQLRSYPPPSHIWSPPAPLASSFTLWIKLLTLQIYSKDWISVIEKHRRKEALPLLMKSSRLTSNSSWPMESRMRS